MLLPFVGSKVVGSVLTAYLKTFSPPSELLSLPGVLQLASVAMIIAATIARANSLFFINSSLKSIFQLLLYIVLNRGRFLTC
jgi:hypothetical protein